MKSNAVKNQSSLKIPPRAYGKRRTRYSLLAQWYGEERAAVEIAAHTSQPEHISDIIDKVLLDSGKRNNMNVIAGLQSHWQELVGGCFSAYTTPESLRDGKLVIKVRHSALIAELAPSKDLFISAVNKIAGNICSEVVFTVGATGKRG